MGQAMFKLKRRRLFEPQSYHRLEIYVCLIYLGYTNQGINITIQFCLIKYEKDSHKHLNIVTFLIWKSIPLIIVGLAVSAKFQGRFTFFNFKTECVPNTYTSIKAEAFAFRKLLSNTISRKKLMNCRTDLNRRYHAETKKDCAIIRLQSWSHFLRFASVETSIIRPQHRVNG